MSSHLVWNGDAARVAVHGATMNTIDLFVTAVKERAVELISTPGPPRSTPGNPPHVDTGDLVVSVESSVDNRDMTGRVGTNLEYGLYLETGTKRGLAPRPWLRRALAETTARVRLIMAGNG
jgi:hypothetical protein